MCRPFLSLLRRLRDEPDAFDAGALEGVDDGADAAIGGVGGPGSRFRR